MLQNVQPDFNVTDTSSDAYIRNKPAIPTQYDWLCLTAKEDNSTVRLDKTGEPPAIDLEYSTDGATWTTYTWDSTTGATITLSTNGKVYFRGDNDLLVNGVANVHTFVMSGNIEATGNVASLFSKTCSKTVCNGINSLFRNCTALTKADIFHGLRGEMTGLEQCFYGCTGLTSIEIPYFIPKSKYAMAYCFNGCTNLSRIKIGFHSWVTDKFPWLTNVAATGTFICPSDLDCSTRSDYYVPAGWKVERESAPQADWDESDSSDPAYIQNKPTIPVQKNADWDESDSSDPAYILNKPNFSQADWDESDSSDPSYIKGNPTQEKGKGFKIQTSDGWAQISIPTDKTGISTFGLSQGTTIIKGGELQLIGEGSKGISWIKTDNDINITCNNIKKSGNMPNTAGGFAIVDSSTGKLPASIVPAAGYSYDTITNYTLSRGHTYLLDDTARNNAQNANYYALSMPYDNDEVEVHFLVENGNSGWGHFSIGDFRFGYNNSYNGYLRQWTPGFYKYKFRKENGTIKLYNDNGQIIATDASLWGSDGVSVYSIFCNSNGSSEENGAIPLSNDYIPMPCGGYATPVLQGQSLFGIDFDYATSSGVVDFMNFGNNYMHVFSTHPVCLLRGNTINNFLCFNTIAEPVTITFVGYNNGTAHVYMQDNADDLFSSSYTTIESYHVVRLTTWCSYLGSSWLRYFIKEGSNNVWYQEYQTMPAQRT